MRSKVRASIALLALLGACGLAACVIGPKQDDPAAPALAEDSGTTFDTGATATPDGGGFDMDAAADDTGPFSSADSEVPGAPCADGGDGGDASCTSGDASSDGGDASSDAGDAHTSDAGDAPAADALGGD